LSSLLPEADDDVAEARMNVVRSSPLGSETQRRLGRALYNYLRMQVDAMTAVGTGRTWARFALQVNLRWRKKKSTKPPLKVLETDSLISSGRYLYASAGFLTPQGVSGCLLSSNRLTCIFNFKATWRCNRMIPL
jgi:hypothetical protein